MIMVVYAYFFYSFRKKYNYNTGTDASIILCDLHANQTVLLTGTSAIVII